MVSLLKLLVIVEQDMLPVDLNLSRCSYWYLNACWIVVDNWNMGYNGCGINVLSCTIACIQHCLSMIASLEILDIHWL